MAQPIELDQAAVRDVDRLDQPARQQILAFLRDRVATLDNPRSIGEALTGATLGEFWKYRVGEYRVIATIEDHAVCVVKIGNPREVFGPSVADPQPVCERCGQSGTTRVGTPGALCLACRHGSVVDRWPCPACTRVASGAPGRLCPDCERRTG